MPKRTSTKGPTQRPTDISQLAHLLVRESTEAREAEKPVAVRQIVPKAVSKVMAQMGSKGGKIGGKRRLLTLTDEKRREIASQAARARWGKRQEG